MAKYTKADFTIGFLDFGAGIKGKVLESMEHCTISLGNEVGFAGIPCDALKPFYSSDDLIEQIEGFLDVNCYQKAIKEYEHFLLQNYGIGLIREEIKKVISEIKL